MSRGSGPFQSGPGAEGQLTPGGLGLSTVIGQQPAIQRLKEFVALYSQSGDPPAHVLLTGDEGTGKRTIARAFAAEYCRKLAEIEAKELKRTGDLMGIVTNLAEGDAVLVGDIAGLPKRVADLLLMVLRDFRVDFSAVPLKVEQAQLDTWIDVGNLIVQTGKPL